MNGLSWFLYFVDISSGLRAFLWILFVGSIIAMVIVPKKGVDIFSDEHDSPFQGVTRPIIWVGFILFAIFALAVPSKDTLYLIAASELGEQVIALEEVQALGGEVGGLASDTIALLREKIQGQLTTEKP